MFKSTLVKIFAAAVLAVFMLPVYNWLTGGPKFTPGVPRLRVFATST